MLKKVFVVAGLCALAAAVPAAPPEQDAPKAMKVGVVNLRTCFEKYDRVKDIDSELSKLGEEYQKELKRLEDKVRDLRSKLEGLNKEMALYWEKLGELKLTENELKFKREFGRQRWLNRYTELQVEVYNEIRTAVGLIGAEQKFDLVLRVEEPLIEEEGKTESVLARINARVVLYHSDSLDITDMVVKRLNQEHAKTKAGHDWECAKCKIKNKGPECTGCKAKKP